MSLLSFQSYGLLGPSSCGKTTLLTCIVGLRKIDSGEIWTLGGRPGDEGSGIPGPRVGYMPQETSLVGEFSIMGTLYYFGRICGLNDELISENFILEYLFKNEPTMNEFGLLKVYPIM